MEGCGAETLGKYGTCYEEYTWQLEEAGAGGFLPHVTSSSFKLRVPCYQPPLLFVYQKKKNKKKNKKNL